MSSIEAAYTSVLQAALHAYALKHGAQETRRVIDELCQPDVPAPPTSFCAPLKRERWADLVDD